MIDSLADLLHDQLRDLYDAENQYLRLLPRMIDGAVHTELREFLIATEVETHHNAQALVEVCADLGVSADGLRCEAMDGLIREARRNADNTVDSATLDAALIANAQRIAHYEIAGFGTASAFARCLKANSASTRLAELADSAGERDRALTRIAVGGWFDPGVNEEAALAAG